MAAGSKQSAMAALDAALAGAPMDDPAAGAMPATVDCKVCGYTIDAVTGEPVEEMDGAAAVQPL